MQTMLEELLELYVQRDLEGIRVLSESYMKKGDSQVAAYFQQTIINDRNLRMLQCMQPRLKEGNAFSLLVLCILRVKRGCFAYWKNRGCE